MVLRQRIYDGLVCFNMSLSDFGYFYYTLHKRQQQYLELKSYKSFSDKEAREWGKKYYSDWFPELQNQEYNPETPCEKFFRYYTQGIDYVFNKIIRYSSIDEYDFNNSGLSKEMFRDSIAEINKRRLCENIVVYRYVSKNILSVMKNGVMCLP